VLGTVGNGVGHEDAAGVWTSAGAPLWFISGCSPQHTSLGGREDVGTARSKPQEDKVKKIARCSAKGHQISGTDREQLFSSQLLGTVGNGVGHEDAAGVWTSAGAPLWLIRGCSPQHTSFGGREYNEDHEDHEIK
jgi:hypothetical protein